MSTDDCFIGVRSSFGRHSIRRCRGLDEAEAFCDGSAGKDAYGRPQFTKVLPVGRYTPTIGVWLKAAWCLRSWDVHLQ
jgi:hypothetical protein